MHSESNVTGFQCDIHGKLSERKTLKKRKEFGSFVKGPSLSDLPGTRCLYAGTRQRQLLPACLCVCVC